MYFYLYFKNFFKDLYNGEYKNEKGTARSVICDVKNIRLKRKEKNRSGKGNSLKGQDTFRCPIRIFFNELFTHTKQKLFMHQYQGTQHLLAAGGVGLAAGLAAAAATGQPTVPAAPTQQLPFQQHQQVNF